MNQVEISGTNCIFASAGWRVQPCEHVDEKYLNMCGPTLSPLQLTRSPTHCTGASLCTITTLCLTLSEPPTGTKHIATCWADVRKPPAGSLCCWNNTLHINTWPCGEEEKKSPTVITFSAACRSPVLRSGKVSWETKRLKKWEHLAGF